MRFFLQNDIEIVRMRLKMTFQQVKRLFQEPETSYFLFGPRGTGKSTLAAMRHPTALMIDLRLHGQRLRFSANPDLLKALVEALPDSSTIPDASPLFHP